MQVYKQRGGPKARRAALPFTKDMYNNDIQPQSGVFLKDKPNHYFMDALTRYIRATAAELSQVSWPTQHQAMLYTALVIGITVVVALYVGVFDYLFAEVIAAVTNAF